MELDFHSAEETGLYDQRKVIRLAVAGVAAVILGFAWGAFFPVIKKLWTSSYVLVAAGYSCLFLALFHQINNERLLH